MNQEEVVIEDEDDEIDLETSYEEWLRDTRSRGFKRKTPVNAVEYNRVNQDRAEQKRRQTNPPRSQPRDDDRVGQDQVRYCHNWNNRGNVLMKIVGLLINPLRSVNLMAIVGVINVCFRTRNKTYIFYQTPVLNHGLL